MDLSPTRGIKLRYYYILNPYSTDEKNVNLFGSDIDRMNILVFNEDRVLVQDTLINNPWELQDDHPEDSSHVKSIHTPAHLYYGAYRTIESKPDAITGATVPITKNTNTIHVKIGGISHLLSPYPLPKTKTKASADAPIDVFITARNGHYKYDNSIGEYARTVRYEQPYQSIHPDTMLVTFTVLRLMEEDKTSRVVLENRAFLSGQLSLDIIAAIIRADERINNQNDLDKHDVYNITINLDKNLTATIWINGWLYNTIYPG